MPDELMKTKTVTLRSLRALLKKRFKGVLLSGSHEADSKACALELHSQALGIEWTDSPEKNRT